MRLDITPRFIAVWQRNMQVYRRFIWSNIVTGLVEPLVFLFGLGLGVGRFIPEMEGLPYTAFIAPGIIASSAMFGASFENTFGTYIRLHFQKTFHAITAAPISIDEVVAAEVLYGATKSTLSGVTVLAAIYLFGLVPQFHWTALLVPVIAFLIGLLFAATAMNITALVPNIDSFNYYITLGLTPMFVISGIFYPIEALPPYAQTIAWFTPLMHGVRLVRGLVLGQPDYLLGDLIWLVVATVLLLPPAFLLMRRKLTD